MAAIRHLTQPLVQHHHVAALKHKFKGSNDEWVAVLSHFLLQQQPDIGQSDLLQRVRMVYTLKNKQLAISFRQDVQNIKVRHPIHPIQNLAN